MIKDDIIVIVIFVAGVLALTFSARANECEDVTNVATVIHMAYVDGNSTLRDSYNATAIMNEVCK